MFRCKPPDLFPSLVLIAFNIQPNILQKILFEIEINNIFGFSFLIYLMLIYQIKTREKINKRVKKVVQLNQADTEGNSSPKIKIFRKS